MFFFIVVLGPTAGLAKRSNPAVATIRGSLLTRTYGLPESNAEKEVGIRFWYHSSSLGQNTNLVGSYVDGLGWRIMNADFAFKDACSEFVGGLAYDSLFSQV